MKHEKNGIWMNLFSPSEAYHRFRLSIWVFIAAIFLIGVGGLSWYFGVVRPRLNAESIKVYRSTIPETKEIEETTESSHTSVHETHLRNANENQAVAEETSLSSPSSGVSIDTGTEGSTVSSETLEQAHPKQNADAEKQKRAKALAEVAELKKSYAEVEKSYQAIVGEVEAVDSMISQILSLENSGADDEAVKNSVMPLLVKQLNASSANEQREHFDQFRRMISSTVSDPVQTNEIFGDLLKTLTENGFVQKF